MHVTWCERSYHAFSNAAHVNSITVFCYSVGCCIQVLREAVEEIRCGSPGFVSH